MKNGFFNFTHFYSGVDFELEGNGGQDCLNYIRIFQRFIESVLFISLAIYGIYCSFQYLFDEDECKTEEVEEFMTDTYTQTNTAKYSSTPTPSDPFIGFSDSHILANRITHFPIHSDNKVNSNEYVSNVLPINNALFLLHWRMSLHSTIITAYCLIFGAELTYKIMSRTLIFLLNPCHLTTILQLGLLVFPNSSYSKSLFRFQNYTIAGALLALLFPILNTRLLPGEQFIYFLQHLFILLVPVYFISLKGTHFKPEPLINLSWPVFSYSILILYHFIVLQPVALLTEVNLNCILCPGVSDPFGCKLWRIIAVTHQAFFSIFIAKIYNLISRQFVYVIKRCDFSVISSYIYTLNNNNNLIEQAKKNN
uniref:Transmembrane protein 164 n=1 Tax=Rhabditophanes sp. KR3021 TaxID=114890 RepID=A0AC35UHN7_9BILA